MGEEDEVVVVAVVKKQVYQEAGSRGGAVTGKMGYTLCGCGLSLNKTLLRTFLKVHTRPRLAYTPRCRGY